MAAPSPLAVARREAALSLRALGNLVHVSAVTCWRWEEGRDRPRPAVFEVLAGASAEALAQDHARWLASQRLSRRTRRTAIEIALPPGMDAEAAQRICTDALASLVAGRREGAR